MDLTSFKFSGSYNNLDLVYEAKTGLQESKDENKTVEDVSSNAKYTYDKEKNEYRWKDSQAIDMICNINFQKDSNVQRLIGEHYDFRYKLTHENAVPPARARGSDSGFDLTIVDKVKSFGKVTLYTTGVIVQPGSGFYFDLVPRSSISKTGYMMANNIGIIDQSYTGEVMVALLKHDDEADDIQLPCRIAQLIPRRWMNVSGVKVDSFDETARNTGGFGSTDEKPKTEED